MLGKNSILSRKFSEAHKTKEFKPLFLPIFSGVTSSMGFLFFAVLVLYPSITYTEKGVFLYFCFVLLFVPIYSLIFTYLLTKIIGKLVISEEGLFIRKNRWNIFAYAGWKDIVFVKASNIFGSKILHIKTLDNKTIHITPGFYEDLKILEQIRQLAGEDHPLVDALKQSTLHPFQITTKLLLRIMLLVTLLISIWLIGGNLVAFELEKPMKQAITSYIRQYPNQPPNQSAIELQSLMAKLGLSEKVFGDGSKVTVKPDQGSWIRAKVLEQELDKYLTIQLYNIKDSYHATPAKLKEYLQEHQADIEAIENHLLTKPLPQWGTDLSWLEKDNPNGGDKASSTWTKYLSLNELQRILAVNILDKNQSPKTEISKDLIALERILQSLQNQATEEGQFASRTGERRIAKLARQLHNTPSTWGENLFNQHRYSAAILGSEKFLMIGNKVLQDPETIEQWSKDKNTLWLWLTKYHRLIQPYLRIGAVDFFDKNQHNLSLSKKRSLCHLPEIAKITYSPVLNEIANQKTSIRMINDYDKVALNDWRWELTSAVRQVKDQVMQGQTINQAAQKFNMPSTVCPGEKWIAKAENNSVMISFSKELDWEALNINKSKNNPDFEQLPYRVQQIAKG
jgi:hypothetical protein